MREELARIVRQLELNNGTVRPRDLLEKAEPEDSPIHDMFIWDDSIAAANYRLQQARSLIVSIKNETPTGRKQEFHKVRINPSSEYASLEHLATDEEMRNSAIKKALGEIAYWQSKYNEIEELSGIVDEEKVEAIKAKVA